ncbi:MAG: PQQ-dependent dehydrogenase, methanol/ethanol family [Candidatus Rokuibacteriota bacterium]|nr:MAG: PQQ-dependent dehydrogenase, methanol/ethanol family [Candidatus Rokubacteria bacterium]
MTHVQRTLAASVLSAALILAASSAWAQSGSGWLMYGGDYANTRYSSLNQIDTSNVGRLRVAWMRSLGTLESQEATPIVVGDMMYVSTSTGPRYVFAFNAKDGAVKWKYEPELPTDFAATVCCGLDSRGVAYANGKVFVTRLDAKMVALDANTGKELWSVTVVDYKVGHAITSPPVVYKNLVVTGYAGGEYGVRGAVQAYNQNTGELVWKTYTIPAAGEPGNDTWKGDAWKTGGGSTWYVGSYDPTLNLLYWGTSNAGPWGGHTRSTDSSQYGQYTNLHTASQLAFDGDTGKLVWAYQMTPADVWDYDAVNEAVLADLNLGGQTTPALMKADRNGFFYVLNRQNGRLLSAEPFVHVNWAKGIDTATGRPVEDPEKRPQLDRWARNVCPNLFGGKNWEPMSYSQQTGLVYIPTFNLCMDIAGKNEAYNPGKFYLASEFDLDKADSGGFLSELKAWDPVKRAAVWGIKEDLPFMGGVMSTAGGLVFYGNQRGELKAVDAKTGRVLWTFNVGTGILQSPTTYMIDGRQYVAVVAGRVKGPPSFLGKIGQKVIDASPEGGLVVVFELAN